MGIQQQFRGLDQTSQARMRKTVKLSRKLMFVAMLAMGAGGLGCSGFSGASHQLSYNSGWNEFVQGYRNSVWSAKAWNSRKNQFCGEKYLHDFSIGFRAGYEDVAAGSNGCTPAFPPREYWSWKYQSAEGQAKVAAWFSGYPHGARAAEEDGVGNWTQIQTSTNIQSEYAQAGLMANEKVGMYPIPMSGQGQQCATPACATPMNSYPSGTILEPSAGPVSGSASDFSTGQDAPRFTPVPDGNTN